MKILMLSSTIPYPPTRGGMQVRTFNLLKYLSRRHAITMITQPSPQEVSDADLEKLRELVEELVVFPQPQALNTNRGILRKVQCFSSFLQQGTPPNVLHLYSPEI